MMSFDKKDDKWVNFKRDLELMKETVDPRYLIESLGFKIERETPKEIRAACVIHGGDNETAFRFNKERGTWVCFTHKCHEVFGNDIIGLIKARLNLNFLDSVLYLKDIVGDVHSDMLEYRAAKERQRFIENSKRTDRVIARDVNEEALSYFKPLRSNHFVDEGFTTEVLDFFEIAGGWVDKEGLIRDIIPIRDDLGVLVAYALRDIRRDVSYDRKYIFTPGFSKDKVLYNMVNAKKYGAEKRIIVVEGQKSVLRLHQYGIYNVVATMGSEITRGQRQLLYRYALKGIAVFFDNDEAGIGGSLKAHEDLKGKLDIDSVFLVEVDKNGKGLDPSDLSEDKIKDYLNYYI
jgi:5S rRNA maturation endonuclease (ribonuclease M5)